MHNVGRLCAGQDENNACTSLACASPAQLLAGYENGDVVVFDLRLADGGGADGRCLRPQVTVAMDAGVDVEDLLWTPAASPVCVVASGERVTMLDLRRTSSSTGNPASAERACPARLAVVDTAEKTGPDGLRSTGGAEARRLPVGEAQRLALHSKGEEVAVAGDSGSIGLLRLNVAAGEMVPGRILRNGHANVCSSLSYVCWRPWELVSGGMDNTFFRWDTSRARILSSWGTSLRTRCAGAAPASEASTSTTHFTGPMWPERGGVDPRRASGDDEMDETASAQLFNPPFVHDIAIPSARASAGGKGTVTRAMAAACGDGSILVTKLWGGGGGTGKTKKSSSAAPAMSDVISLGHEEGGHTSSASCVSFLSGCGDGEGPRNDVIVSCGNDRRIILWSNVLSAFAEADGRGPKQGRGSGECGGSARNQAAQCTSTSTYHGRKLNRLCVTSDEPCSAEIAVADTSNVVTLYRI